MPLSLEDAVSSIKDHPNQFELLYQEVQEEGLLDTPIRDNAWSPRQIFHHLADSHLNSYIRIKLALTEEHPIIKPYAEPKWAELHDVTDAAIEDSLQIVKGIHQRIGVLLEKLLSNDREAFARTFHHPENGKNYTLEEYIKSFAGHGISHLRAVRVLVENSRERS